MRSRKTRCSPQAGQLHPCVDHMTGDVVYAYRVEGSVNDKSIYADILEDMEKKNSISQTPSLSLTEAMKVSTTLTFC